MSDTQNELDKDKILLNAGDFRTENRVGNIRLGDGTTFPINIESVRTRNDHGGVDVTIKVPSITLKGRKT